MINALNVDVKVLSAACRLPTGVPSFNVYVRAGDTAAFTCWAGTLRCPLEGAIVDLQWYDYVDFMIAKKTPETMARAKSMMAQGARIEGIPGSQERIRLWEMDGMCTKVDLAANTVYLINASGGEPDKPAPDSGEVIQMPQVVSPAGKAALQSIKVGDTIVTVYSVQTALKATIIR